MDALKQVLIHSETVAMCANKAQQLLVTAVHVKGTEVMTHRVYVKFVGHVTTL